ncbi:GMC family oxidoreductase [Streptomyces tibetensis]|uniref:GMC family oxidoreductase n=1 Tax=Streptomyces tibetensis TaxID=2382123 RepID=UPI0033ED9883
MDRESYDYIVVGAGSAGCALAARLSEDPDVTVALIEAGPPARGRLFEIPALFSQQLKTTFDWDFETDPEPQLGGRRAYLPRGRVIGGTSSMNTMLYVRGHRYDYDTWDRLGNPGWGYDDVLPFFKKSEDNERGADDFHGVGGPLTVPLLTAWVEAAQEAGYQHNSDCISPAAASARFQLRSFQVR